MMFHEYFQNWIDENKAGAVLDVTLEKYRMTYVRLRELAPDLELNQLNRINYQKILNGYALTHERQTTRDFHRHLHSAILDAVDDGLLEHDPARKAVIRGKIPAAKKKKYLSQAELKALMGQLNLENEINEDWLILLAAKTGIRFAEALGLTPSDFDFVNNTLSISKTWDYKDKNQGGFVPTKTTSSIRTIPLDSQTIGQFKDLLKNVLPDRPIFVKQDSRVFGTTYNNLLARYCKAAGIPTISMHGLRHTHASLLLYSGVSIASVAKRLGHSNMTTTQQTYLHIVEELENKDKDRVMQHLAALDQTS